jgi:hypothetical protein
VIENTLYGIRDGLVEWGLQGAHYCCKDRESGRVALVEIFSCRECYAGQNVFESLLTLYDEVGFALEDVQRTASLESERLSIID